MDMIGLPGSQNERPSDGRFLNLLAEAVVVYDRFGTVVHHNDAALAILGVTSAELIGSSPYESRWMQTNEDGTPIPGAQSPVMICLREKRVVRDRIVGLNRGDGVKIWLSVNAMPLGADDATDPGGIVAVFDDITNRKSLERTIRRNEAQFRDILRYAPIGMTVVSLDGRFRHVNDALCEIVGYTPQELKDLTFREITHPDDLEADLANLARLTVGAIPMYQREKRYIRKDGSIVWIQLTVSLLRDEIGTPLSFIAQVQDIGERREAMIRLQDISTRDPLTGLLNRRELETDLSDLVRAARQAGENITVVMADIDHFKRVNDTFGHAAGDEVLREIAKSVRRHVRRGDRVYRFGGEEFLIVFASSEVETVASVERIRQEVARSLTRFGTHEIATTISFGVATAGDGDPASAAADLVRAADAALYRAKQGGRNRIEVA